MINEHKEIVERVTPKKELRKSPLSSDEDHPARGALHIIWRKRNA